jgi:hypothetical protein
MIVAQLRYCTSIYFEGLRKIVKSLRIISVLVNIKARHLSNVSKELYHLSELAR